MKATRAMVAKRAGVSVSSVSYILNDTRYVSPKLKEKVYKAIEELNYYPDMVARSMVTKESKMLTIIANNLLNSMYGEIIMEFEKAAMEKGYFVNICSGLFSLKQYVGMMLARRIDGLYYASLPEKVEPSDINNLLNNDVSIVCGNYLLPHEDRVNRVDIDYYGGMELAIEHLVGLKHKNIVYLNGFQQDFEMDVKGKAFLEIMKSRYGQEEPKVIYGFGTDKLTDIEGKILLNTLLQKYPDTTAIICYSDLMAYGVLQELHRMRISVPEDISVIGIENLNTSQFTYPPLTSLSFERSEFSKKVVDIMIENIKTKKIKSGLVPMNLCVRESTALCKY